MQFKDQDLFILKNKINICVECLYTNTQSYGFQCKLLFFNFFYSLKIALSETIYTKNSLKKKLVRSLAILCESNDRNKIFICLNCMICESKRDFLIFFTINKITTTPFFILLINNKYITKCLINA